LFLPRKLLIGGKQQDLLDRSIAWYFTIRSCNFPNYLANFAPIRTLLSSGENNIGVEINIKIKRPSSKREYRRAVLLFSAEIAADITTLNQKKINIISEM
jgi:hypothetical protein